MQEHYFTTLRAKIHTILARKEKTDLSYDLLDTARQRKHKLIALQVKHRQMKVGEIWQAACGSFDGFADLKVGHASGLDGMNEERKIVYELKNRTNTDNASSKKSNLDKLARFKQEHPDFTCVYAYINDTTEDKTLTGSHTVVTHHGVVDVDVHHIVGMAFLQFIFGEHAHEVVEFVRNTIDAYDEEHPDEV